MHADNRRAYPGCSACALPGCPESPAATGPAQLAGNVPQESHGVHLPDTLGSDRPGPDLDETGPLRGWQFAIASFGIFPLPVLLAICGAILGTGSLGGQLVWAMVGLGIGMGGTAVVARTMWRTDSEHS